MTHESLAYLPSCHWFSFSFTQLVITSAWLSASLCSLSGELTELPDRRVLWTPSIKSLRKTVVPSARLEDQGLLSRVDLMKAKQSNPPGSLGRASGESAQSDTQLYEDLGTIAPQTPKKWMHWTGCSFQIPSETYNFPKMGFLCLPSWYQDTGNPIRRLVGEGTASSLPTVESYFPPACESQELSPVNHVVQAQDLAQSKHILISVKTLSNSCSLFQAAKLYCLNLHATHCARPSSKRVHSLLREPGQWARFRFGVIISAIILMWQRR